MPAAELAMFKQNLQYARGLCSTAVALSAQFTAAFDTDDLLRSSLAQGVSAFDHFVHEEVRARMLLIQGGALPMPVAFRRFRVNLGSVSVALSSTNLQWLELEIREQHGILSFQKPDKVADAIRLVSDVTLWQAVAGRLGKTPDRVKVELQLIVDRRNKIVHEADTDPTPPRTRYPINSTLVTQSLDFLEDVVNGIVAVI